MDYLFSHPLLLALIGTGFTFLFTAFGAGIVFFFKQSIPQHWNRIFLGFAAGVMVAAAMFSLLQPALEMAEKQGMVSWIPVVGGFVIGGLFLWILDTLLPHLHPGSRTPEGLPAPWHRSVMLMLAVTLHNIPEGMAVGLMFGLSGAESGISIAAAMSLALGIGLQNLPEGAAISLPLKQDGYSSRKAFFYGALSGIVEPIAGVLTVLVAGSVLLVMPWLLSFAAGAMIYVVVEELIPAANEGTHSNAGTIGIMAGFTIMMFLDIALG